MQIRAKFIVAVCSLLLTITASGQSATTVSAGQFGATTGGGNYSFPSVLSVGTTDTLDPLLGTSKFQVADGTSKLSFRDHASGNPWLLLATPTKQGIFHLNVTDGVVLGAVTQDKLTFRTYNINRMTIDAAGNVGIGTTGTLTKRLEVNGDINVTGNINAKYQDVAEWVPVVSRMEPGTVVIVSADKRNEVMPSARAYDTAVAGVVSAQPGITLGEPGDDKAKIATTGRVRVHVDASRGAIRAGDLLVTSDKPGTAMRSEPMAIGEFRLHRPGTVIGKALEPLASGEGDILVLLSMQ